MASKVVKVSGLSIFVKDVQVAAAGTALADVPKVNDLVAVGNVAGLVGQTPRKGEDGAFYATVDTAALIRVSNVSGAYADKATVYLKASDKSLASAAGSGLAPIGYADRPKGAPAGELWVQLVPKTGA